jgi:integrase/recombinase XerD
VFFEVVAKGPAEVAAADVFAFLAEQRTPRRGERVVRIEDGEPGLAARTIARRLSSVSGLFAYLLARRMRAWLAARSRAGWRAAARGAAVRAGCGWCARRGRCDGCSRPPRSMRC